VLLAALQGVPDDLVENALLDTQSRWQIFWHVSLPQPAATIVIVNCSFRFAESLKLLDIPFRAYSAAAQASPPSPIRSWRTAPACATSTSATPARWPYGLLIFVMIINHDVFSAREKYLCVRGPRRSDLDAASATRSTA